MGWKWWKTQKSLSLEDIPIVGSPLMLTTDAEVSEMEKSLGTAFPSGYREYITTLGYGLTGSLVQIYPPWKILHPKLGLQDWRKGIDKYWFWDDSSDVLEKSKALECIIFGHLTIGEQLIFHPSAPDDIYVISHDEEAIFKTGPGLLPAIEWICTSDVLIEPFDDREFEPYDESKVTR